jgi:sigma-B regulation protein RsbU (phosphoserine phosphatase)
MANAGHQHPVLCSNQKIENIVVESGLPLGIQRFDYTEYSFLLNSGEKFFLFSDGVTEAMDSRKNMFGEEGIIQSLKKQQSNVATLYSDVKTFIEGNPLSDDLTIVMIEAV